MTSCCQKNSYQVKKHGFARHKSDQKTPSAPKGTNAPKQKLIRSKQHQMRLKRRQMCLKRRQMCLKWRQMRCEICQEPRMASKCVAKYAKSLEQRPNTLRKILKTLMNSVKSAGLRPNAFKRSQNAFQIAESPVPVSDLPRSNVFEWTSKQLNDAK